MIRTSCCLIALRALQCLLCSTICCDLLIGRWIVVVIPLFRSGAIVRLQFCVCHGGFDLLIDLRTMVTTLTMVSLLTVVAFRRLSVLDVSFGHQGSMQRKSNTESEWMPHPLLAILGTKGCHAAPCWPHKTGLAHWCTDGEWMHIVSILPSGPG